jgi:hypothetical protein
MDDGFRIVDVFIQDNYILYLMMDLMIWIWIAQFDLQRTFIETFQHFWRIQDFDGYWMDG